jgi:hypothetical protein
MAYGLLKVARNNVKSDNAVNPSPRFGVCLRSAPRVEDIFVNQEGNQNPTSNGFVGGLGSASGAAWNIQSSWCCGYNIYSLSGAQVGP